MTVRYRDLPAVSFAPRPIDLPQHSMNVQRTRPSISPGGLLHFFYVRQGSVTVLFSEYGETFDLRPPPGSTFQFPFVQRFSDGRWLAVESRTTQREPNAFVFEPDGSFSHSFYAGDGIETVQIDNSDEIWIGYFDEGVFSSRDVTGAHAALVLGPSGLARLDDWGELLFQFNGNASAGERFIGDVYALTIDQEGRAWFCPYDEFFVASIDADNIEFPLERAPEVGAQGLSVGPDHLAFFGGYFRSCVVTVVERATNRLRLIQLLDQEGGPLSIKPGRISTRGQIAVAMEDGLFYRLDLDLLLDSLGPWDAGNSTTVDSAIQYIDEESSYASGVLIDFESGKVRDYPGRTRPPENRPRNDCVEPDEEP